MGRIDKRLVGTRAATGVVLMRQDPDFTNGRGDSGPVHTLPYLSKVANIVIETTATVSVEGNNGNPNNAADWVQLQEFVDAAGSGTWENKDPWAFVRFNVSAWTAGDVTVQLACQSS